MNNNNDVKIPAHPVVDFVNSEQWKKNYNEEGLITINVFDSYDEKKNKKVEISFLDIIEIQPLEYNNDLTNYTIIMNNQNNYRISKLQYEILIEFLKPLDLSIDNYQKFLEDEQNEIK